MLKTQDREQMFHASARVFKDPNADVHEVAAMHARCRHCYRLLLELAMRYELQKGAPCAEQYPATSYRITRDRASGVLGAKEVRGV